MQAGNLVLPYTKSIASSNPGKAYLSHIILDAFILIIHEIICAHVCYLSADIQWVLYNGD